MMTPTLKRTIFKLQYNSTTPMSAIIMNLLQLLFAEVNDQTNPIVTLSKTTIPTAKQECVRQKNKKKEIDGDDETTVLEDDVQDDHTIVEKAKVGVNTNDDTSGEDDATIPKELESELGPYWTLAESVQTYVLNTIASYSNIEASKSTPQYGFNRGLKEFGTLGYEATVKELDDNLLGMEAVKMLNPSEINKDIRYEALNYLMFLKRKRCGKVKAR
jgi:hypothetical protein